MSGRKRFRAATVVACAIAGALLALGVAQAAKLTGKSETESLPNDSDTHRLDVSCPKGSRATGGGIRLDDDLNDFVQGTYPYLRRLEGGCLQAQHLPRTVQLHGLRSLSAIQEGDERLRRRWT